MNITEFMAHRKNCPLCNSENLIFQMGKYGKESTTHRYEDDRVIVSRDMRGMLKGEKSYKVGYSFGATDNSVQIEFYTSTGERFYNLVPTNLLPKFKSLDINLQGHVFTKFCRSCHRYSYTSNIFKLDYKMKTIGKLEIQNEYFGVIKPTHDGYRVYRMHNNYQDKKSTITLFDSSNIDFAWEHVYFNGDPGTVLNLDIIPFTSETEVANRLGNLMPFL